MTVRRFVLLAVLGVLAGVAVWLPGRLGGGSESDGAAPPLGAASASSSGTAQAVSPTAPSGSPSSSGRASGPSTPPATALATAPSTRPSGTASPSASGGAGIGGIGGSAGGTEVLPQPSSAATTQTGLPLPKQPPAGPLVSMPLPPTAYANGAIVTGYPAALRPPARSTVETSSVSAANDILQVALTARCARPCDVLRHYRVTLGKRGFHEFGTISAGNAPAAALRRGKDTVDVTVIASHRTGVQYAVLAILHAGA